MDKLNKYLSLEILLASLLIVSFFLPWFHAGLVLVVGLDIPEIQRKITKVQNFFVRNKAFVYEAYAVYLIPILSIIVIALWIKAKKNLSRYILFVNSIFAFFLSLYLFYKLSKYAGNGVYMLCAVSLISIAYLVYIFRKKKADKKLSADIILE